MIEARSACSARSRGHEVDTDQHASCIPTRERVVDDRVRPFKLERHRSSDSRPRGVEWQRERTMTCLARQFLLVTLVLLTHSLSAEEPNPQVNTDWKSAFDAGLAAYREQKLDEARSHWMNALSRARLQGSDARYIATLQSLADLEKGSDRLPEAEAYTREAQETLKQVLLANQLSYLTTRTSLAKILERQAKYEQAFALLSENVSLYRQFVRGDNPILADPHLDLARFHRRRGDLVAADAQFREAVTMLGSHVTGRRISALKDYAEVLEELGRADEAAKRREEALMVEESFESEVQKNRDLYIRSPR